MKSLCLYLCPFLKFYILNVVSSLSDFKPNADLFDRHKSSINPKGPPNITLPSISPPKMLTNLNKPRGVYSGFLQDAIYLIFTAPS